MKNTLNKINTLIDNINVFQEYLLSSDVWNANNKSLDLRKLNLLLNTYKLHTQFLMNKIIKEEINKLKKG